MDLGSGWTLLSIWGLVVILAQAYRILQAFVKIREQRVRKYRIEQGRAQINEWLAEVGKHLDYGYKEGAVYSKDSIKKFLAEVSVSYFKKVVQKNPDPE